MRMDLRLNEDKRFSLAQRQQYKKDYWILIRKKKSLILTCIWIVVIIYVFSVYKPAHRPFRLWSEEQTPNMCHFVHVSYGEKLSSCSFSVKSS